MVEHVIGSFAWFGALCAVLMVITLVFALGCAIVDKVQKFRRSHDRKREMERRLEELEARVKRLEEGE